jgi:hypothetical protein
MSKSKNTRSGATSNKSSKRNTKSNDELQRQARRTELLNKLAGELNSVIKLYSPGFKSNDFYIRLQKAFRQEPLDNRFILLTHLPGMEINPNYKSDRGYVTHKIETRGRNIVLTINTILHPQIENQQYDFNCYYHEVILITWDKTNNPAHHSHQLSEWIYTHDKRPEFEFIFPKPAGTAHWLLCLRRLLGFNDEIIPGKSSQSMHIAEVGTFDKEEKELLDKLKKEREKKIVAREKVDKVVRVKAKKKE